MARRSDIGVTFTKIVTAYKETNPLVANFNCFEEEPSKAEAGSYTTHSLMFTTYPPNVPEPEPYTINDAIDVANDPQVLALYEPPFLVYLGYFRNRPAMFVESHAISSIASSMIELHEMEETRVVIRDWECTEPYVVDLRGVIEACTLPEKHIYDCNKCLTVATTLEHSCIIRKTMAADNPRFETLSPEELAQKMDATSHHYYGNRHPRLIPRDIHTLRSSGKVDIPYKSRVTKMAGHLYVSPVMFSTGADNGCNRRRAPAFTGIRDIGIEDINFSSYTSNLETRQNAAKERKRHIDNEKTYCTQCSVKDVCHNHYPYKKKFCTDPLPSYDKIQEKILERFKTYIETSYFTRETLMEILLCSDERPVYNPGTNRTVKGYLGLCMDQNDGSVTFVVRRTSDESKIFIGKGEGDWFKFKKDNNIDTSAMSNCAKENVYRWLDEPDNLALLLAAINIRQSPHLSSGWHSTSYTAVFVEVNWGRISVAFHQPSRKGKLHWTLDVEDWSSLFKLYGRIPGYY